MKNKIFIAGLLLALSFAVFGQTSDTPVIPDVQFYIDNLGYPTGPFNLLEISSLIRSRKVTGITLVWNDKMTNWTEAGLVPELFGMFSDHVYTQQSEARSSSPQIGTTNQNESNQQTMQTMTAAPGERVQTLTEEQKTQVPRWAAMYADWLVKKYSNINFADREMMQMLFNKHKNAGIGLAVAGCFVFVVGAFCAQQFYIAGAIGHIYKAVNGHKLLSDMQMTDTDKVICSLGDNGKAPIEMLP